MFNLKSNKNLKEIIEYKKFLNTLDFNNHKFILFPSNIYLPFFYNANYNLGVQNLSEYENGSITGEILPNQLKSLKVKYVLLNHIEVNDNLNKVINKIKIATKNQIKVVLIIGEKEKEIKERVCLYLKNQIALIFSSLNDLERKNIILTYEPSWMINQNFEINYADLKYILGKLKEYINIDFNIDINICYGGGITEDNIKELAIIDNLDGYLIGNAAINPEKVSKLLSNI